MEGNFRRSGMAEGENAREKVETGTVNRYIPSGQADCTSVDRTTSAVATRIVTSFRHAPSTIVVVDRASFFVAGCAPAETRRKNPFDSDGGESLHLLVAIGSVNMATEPFDQSLDVEFSG